MEKTPGCQLCESEIPTFNDEQPSIVKGWPKFHIIGYGVSSYSVPCNAEERAKMEDIQKRLDAMEAKKAP